MVNFFGLYIDPVYVLILTVVLVSLFLVVLGRIMLDMVNQLKTMTKYSETSAALLEKSLTELSTSEVTRLAREAAHIAFVAHVDTIDELRAQIDELKRKEPDAPVHEVAEPRHIFNKHLTAQPFQRSDDVQK